MQGNGVTKKKNMKSKKLEGKGRRKYGGQLNIENMYMGELESVIQHEG